MAKTVLSSGIRGIDWQESVNSLSQVSDLFTHHDNVMLNTNNKFDELIIQTSISDSQLKSAKKQFKQYLAKLAPNKKNLINFYSAPDFLDSGNAWHEINSSNTFLFFFCSPEYYLTKSQVKDEKLDKQEALDNWLEDATKIWDFYTRFPENTHVINIADVESDITSSVKSIATSLEIKKINISGKETIEKEMNFEQLSFLLSQSLSLSEINDKNEIQELFDNLSMVSAIADDNTHHNRYERAAQLLQKCYQLSLHLETDNSKLKIAFDEQSTQRHEEAKTHQENTKVVIELTKQNDNLLAKTEMQSLTIAELENCHAKLENTVTELTTENELTLLQIRQLQEDLESTYIQSKHQIAMNSKLEAKISELGSKNSQLNIELDEQTKQKDDQDHKYQENKKTVVELKKQNDNLLANTDKRLETIALLENNATVLTTENELCLLQINQLQEELESTYIQSNQQSDINSKLEAKISELGSKNSQLNIELDEQTKQKDDRDHKYQENKKTVVELKKQNDNLLANNDKRSETIALLENNATVLTTENELCLLQISQLQDELESTSIQSNQQNTINSKLEAKISDLGSKNSKLEVVIEDSSTENEFRVLQISQMQDELKSTGIQSNHQDTINSKLEAKISDLGSKNSQLEIVIEDSSTENEICVLQINQLEDELEYQYTQYQKATYSPRLQNSYQVDLDYLKGNLTLMSLC